MSGGCCEYRNPRVLPRWFTRDGLPVDLQVVGKPRGEAALFSAAVYLENLLGVAGLTPIDPRDT